MSSDATRGELPTTLSRRTLGSLYRIGRTLALVYVGNVVVIYFLQGKLIFPGADSQGSVDAVVRPSTDEELVQLTTASGESIVALFGPALDAAGRPLDNARERPTIVFFYGNGASLAMSHDLAHLLRSMGANVLIPEYVGYGMSSGRPSERGCYETAAAALAWLRTRPEFDRGKLVFAGWSLGAGVAVELATHEAPAELVLLSPFTSMVEMGQRLYPFLPIRLLLAHRFENIRKAPRIDCPVLVLHGDCDSIIPVEMGRRLAEAFGGTATFRELVGIDHNDLFQSSVTHAQWKQLVERVAGRER